MLRMRFVYAIIASLAVIVAGAVYQTMRSERAPQPPAATVSEPSAAEPAAAEPGASTP